MATGSVQFGFPSRYHLEAYQSGYSNLGLSFGNLLDNFKGFWLAQGSTQ